MIVVGLTGSIGMGKSTVAQMFADAGAAVWSADAAVARLYAKGGAGVEPVGEAFPGALVDGEIVRERLSRLALADTARLKRLERIVHPLVGVDRRQFLKRARAEGAGLVVLDIPLLYEGTYIRGLDAVVVVTAPGPVQRARVLARAGMSEEKLAAILARQMPDAEKRARADYVISTGQSLEETRREVEQIVARLTRRSGGGALLDREGPSSI